MEAWVQRRRAASTDSSGRGAALSELFLSFGPDGYRVRDLVEGVLVVGGNGSSKSSTTIRQIRRRSLVMGFGAMELTAKSTDGSDCLRELRHTGRLRDLVHIQPGGSHRSNVVGECIRRHPNSPEDASDEVADMLRAGMDAVDEGQNASTDPIWRQTSDHLVKRIVDFWFCGRAEGEELTLDRLSELVASAPRDATAVARLKARTTDRVMGKPVDPPSDAFTEYWDRAGDRVRAGGLVVNQFTQRSVIRYWTQEFPSTPEKTRESVLFTLRATLADLTRGEIAEVCCADESTFAMTDARSGAWILVDFPVQKHGRSGRVIQSVLKRQFQRAMEQRAFRPDENGGFVLLLMDEGQYFLSPESDALFQSTARSSRVCTAIATQSIAALRRKLGHEGAEELLGVLQTKWAHACDGDTANYMADLIARDWTYNETFDGEGHVSFTKTLEHQVQPVQFGRLARGGPEFDFEAEAVVFKPGARWGPQGRNFMKVRLSQR